MFELRNEFVNAVGRDGFLWWVGQVEATDAKSKNSNRYKVRIVGHHLQSCEQQSTNDLPWAFAVAPTTAPYSQTGGTTTNLKRGDWVIGFFMDSDNAQQPFILGSVGSVANSKNPTADPKSFVDPNPKGEGCAAFKVFPDQKRNPYVMNSATSADLQQATTPGNVPSTAVIPNSGQPGAPGASSLITNALGCIDSPTVPGKSSCIVISQAECPNGQMATKLEIILSELFEMISTTGGNIGNEVYSKATGLASNYLDIATGYINKILAVVSQGMSWATGQLYALLQLGVQKIVEFLLGLISDKVRKSKKPPYNPAGKEKILDKIQEFLEKNLKKIGCSIADLYDKIAEFLTKLIMDMLVKTLSSAVCAITGAVNSIISQVQQFISEIIEEIMGPLQEILGAIVEPLNVIGGAINTVFQALGISCSGLPERCKKIIKDCNEGAEDEETDEEDFLDELLKKLSKGPSFPLNCKESQKYSSPKKPNILISGGSFIPPETPPVTPPDSDTPDAVTPETEVVTLNILIDPEDAIVTVGEIATFSTAATSSDGSPIAYLWEVSTDNGATFNDVPAGTGNSSVFNTAATVLTDTNKVFRCTITGTGTTPASEFTDIATLTVEDNPVTPVDPAIPTGFSYNSDSIFTLGAIVPVSFKKGFVFTTTAGSPDGSGFALLTAITSYVFTSASVTSPTILPQVYKVVADKLVVKEGEIVKLTITTTNVPDNTPGNYLMFGPNITSSDIVGGNLTGSFFINSNKAEVFVGIAADTSIESDEVVLFALTSAPASTQFVIEADKTTPPVAPDIPKIIPKYPVACDPIVSSTGQILNIPICSIGDKFSVAPNIYVQAGGSGGGASAEAILDADGYITQIKVIRPGRGYVANPPSNTLNCVIRGFTIISPGLGYSGNIVVYINDDPNIATASASNGLIIDVIVKDLSKTYTEYPTVRIVADTGAGAIVLPNIICIPREENAKISESVSITPEGKYIDCP